MSAEVVDSNPYSRLMALQRMGIVKNYESIREFSVAIVVCIYLFFQHCFCCRTKTSLCSLMYICELLPLFPPI